MCTRTGGASNSHKLQRLKYAVHQNVLSGSRAVISIIVCGAGHPVEVTIISYQKKVFIMKNHNSPVKTATSTAPVTKLGNFLIGQLQDIKFGFEIQVLFIIFFIIDKKRIFC